MKNLKTQEEIMVNWKGDIKKPAVSIMCTTYNHESYIEEALEGFLIQETDFPFEIIIHDDASTDRTADIIREYEAKYPKLIRAVYQTVNRFSQGLKNGEILYPMAKGKYIALCEGDDYWTDPLKLQKQVDVFENNPQISICFHPAEEINMLDNKSKIVCKHFSNDNEVPIADVILGRGGYMPTAALMFKNIQMDKVIESYKDAPIGDYFLQVYMASLGTTYFLKDSMCVYRRNASGSWTASQEDLEIRRKYNYSMVMALDNFSKFLHTKTHKKLIYKVMIYYTMTNISSLSSMLEKFVAIYKISTDLKNYNKLIFLLENEARVLKYALL